MTTWHQNKNPEAIRALWTPHPTGWKVIHDRAHCLASAIVLDSEEKAQTYNENHPDGGGIVIPPQSHHAPKPKRSMP